MPDGFEEHFDRAKRALAEGWAEQALVPATEAVKLAPQRADVRVVLARAWLGNGGWARAISDAKAALELDPPSVIAGEAHAVIGRASLKLGQSADAEASLTRARALAPSPQTCALHAAMLAQTDRTREAAAAAKEDAARTGDEWEPVAVAFDALAVELERPERTPGGVRLAIGDLCFDAGLLDDAKSHYQAALAADPASERAADGLRNLAAGLRSRPRSARVKAAPSTARTRMMRLVISGLGGAIAIFTLARWEQLLWLGPIRAGLVFFGFGTTAVCLVLARRDELASRRAAEIAGKGSPT